MDDKLILQTLIEKSLNLPYIWGGQSLTYGVDCSGFVINLLQAVGKFPHRADATAAGLYDYYMDRHATSVKDAPDFGDLCFYGSHRISHIGFCVSSTKMVEAGGGHSRCKTPADARRYNACVRFRPIHYRSDLKDIIRLK